MLSGVSTSNNQQYINGNPTGKILNYQASRNITVNSDNVYLIQKLSQDIGQVLETGANISSSGPQYYVSTLKKLRPRLIAAAMRDAKSRAVALTSATGGSVGSVLSARSGPIQVNAVGSVEVSSGGVYDTTTIRQDRLDHGDGGLRVGLIEGVSSSPFPGAPNGPLARIR